MTNVKVYGRSASSSDGSPLLAGLITSILIIVAWVGLVALVHKPVGVAAWGIGGLLGVVVGKFARPASKAAGTLAAVLTLATVLCAKVAVVVFALRPMIYDELVRNQDAIAALYLIDMSTKREFSPELQRTIDTRPAVVRDTQFLSEGFEIRMQMVDEAEKRTAAASRAERERLVRTYTDRFIDKLGFWWLLLSVFGLLDLLWIGLGVSTAWKLAQGII